MPGSIRFFDIDCVASSLLVLLLFKFTHTSLVTVVTRKLNAFLHFKLVLTHRIGTFHRHDARSRTSMEDKKFRHGTC